ncbi:MAG: Polysacc synt protein [Chloroflexi bacterium]|nr:Polysacc synt protein [Chloroflexota bacterium]
MRNLLHAWPRFFAGDSHASALRRVAKNAAVPMAASICNRLLDFAFAFIWLKALGPTDVGRYTWAVLVVGYSEILISFGLGTLITREVARDPSASGRYLGTALFMRGAIWLLMIMATVFIGGPLAAPLDLTPEMVIALLALTVGIGISSASGLVSALFNAHELMEYPALVSIFTTLAKVTLGVAVLAAGFGFVGLALVSIGVNLMTATALVGLLIVVIGRPRLEFDRRFAALLFSQSYPLMLNSLLATIFFRIDGLMLRSMSGDAPLGWYSTAYKFIDGLNVISSSVTLALFPVLSRATARAGAGSKAATVSEEPRGFLQVTRLGLKALITMAMPLSVGLTFLADPLIRAFAGDDYLPHSAIALQIIVWCLPLSFVNGLLQYALIAANQQRFITISFIVAVVFNVISNILLIPRFSYAGAGISTIASELVLLGPFLIAAYRHVGQLHLLALSWRPALAAAGMAPVVWVSAQVSPLLSIALGGVAYGGILAAIGGLGPDERRMIQSVLPLRRDV